MPDDGTRGQDSAADQHGAETLFVGARRALLGGVLAASVVAAGQWLVGQVYSGTEARSLLEAMIPSARSVGSSVLTAAGTILALMLTMLSLTNQAESDFDRVFFKRVERIGLLSTIALVMGTLLLLFLSVPVQESEQLPSSWYSYVYYVLIGLTASLAGLLVAIVLMLYNALTSLIRVLRPSSRSASSQAKSD
jgi:uncharacterized integral membrane protein